VTFTNFVCQTPHAVDIEDATDGIQRCLQYVYIHELEQTKLSYARLAIA